MNDDNYKIAISAICKEYNNDIVEWYLYHKKIGIDNFILYDNGSVPKLIYRFEQEISDGYISVIDWTKDQRTGKQIRAQKDCVQNFQNFRWVGFFDIDEFVVLLEDSVNIKDYLNRYDNHDGLGLHWLMFGSNGHTERQNSVIYNYTQSCPNNEANKHIKMFINPKKYKYRSHIGHKNPHYIPTIDGSVNVLGETILDPFGGVGRHPQRKPIINQIMRLNHYYTKSFEDFQIKKSRKGGNKANRVYTDQHFNNLQTENIFNDDIIKLYNKII